MSEYKGMFIQANDYILLCKIIVDYRYYILKSYVTRLPESIYCTHIIM